MAAMRLLAPLLVAAPLALATAAAAAEPPINPGYWESTNAVLSPYHQTTKERRCITPADVGRFLSGPINHHYTCVYPTQRIAGGRIAMKGVCTDNKNRKVEVSSRGVYTPSSFHMDATIATSFLGIPVTGRASTDAHRLGDACPPPAAPQPTP
jgi:hypothetical protein